MKDKTQRLVAQLLEEQSKSVAYRRGVATLGRLTVGSHFVDAKLEAIKLGYPSHTMEHHLFVEGFLDAMQDSGTVISTDDAHWITALHHHERVELVQ